MGKYMVNRNPKTPSHLHDIGGVRTRARTLALQKAAAGGGGGSASGGSGGSYIQLRSRRLVKPTPPKRRLNRLPPKSSNSNIKSGVRVSEEGNCNKKLSDDEGSFGENMVEIEAKGRSTRETTPCNLIRDPDTISTPGSSTKRAYSSNADYRVQSPAPSNIPLTIEMDEFFTEPEKQQQQLFIEKYNFDPVNDKPLPGRYEWVKMDGTKNVN